MSAEPDSGMRELSVLQKLGGIAGIVAVIGLIVAILQLSQSISSGQEQERSQAASVAKQLEAQATIASYLERQLEVQYQIATLQAGGSGIPSTGTAIAQQRAELKSTEEALKGAKASFEVTATAIAIRTPTPNSVTMAVSGKQGWQSTGVEVNKGQRVQIIYKNGTWAGRAGLGPTFPDIWADAAGTGYQIYYPEFGITGSFASLIGKVGDGPILQIGRSFDFVTERSGMLYLRMFDTDMSDNAGSINVQITAWQ